MESNKGSFSSSVGKQFSQGKAMPKIGVIKKEKNIKA